MKNLLQELEKRYFDRKFSQEELKIILSFIDNVEMKKINENIYYDVKNEKIYLDDLEILDLSKNYKTDIFLKCLLIQVGEKVNYEEIEEYFKAYGVKIKTKKRDIQQSINDIYSSLKKMNSKYSKYFDVLSIDIVRGEGYKIGKK